MRLFQHSLEDGQPLCSNSAVDHSVVTAEGDTHHIGHLEAAGVGVQGGGGEGVREVKRSRRNRGSLLLLLITGELIVMSIRAAELVNQ